MGGYFITGQIQRSAALSKPSHVSPLSHGYEGPAEFSMSLNFVFTNSRGQCGLSVASCQR